MPAAFTPPARALHTVFVHCSASDVPEHDDVSVMRSWHLANGWADVGYHYFIKKSGEVQPGRALDMIPAAQGEWNPGTIAICLHGLRRDNFTTAQLAALILLCRNMAAAYAARGVTLRFRGHCEVQNKACPVIDYRRVLGLDAAGHMTGDTDPAAQDGGIVPGNMPSRPGAVHVATEPRPLQDGRWPAGTVLRRFSTGPAVAAMQAALNAALPQGPRLAVDGDFGALTEAVVRAFQDSRGLVVDGVAGPATAKALGL